MPEVSRSSRCTSSRNLEAGRAWRSCSITPKLTPLPPCTATPAGLSMAIRCSSSSRMGNSHAGVGTHAAFVDAHLAAADDAVDMRFRHTFQVAYQKVIEPLACGVSIHFHQAGCGKPPRGGGGVGPYNVFHLRGVL